MNNRPRLSPDIFFSIMNVFKENGWDIPENDPRKSKRFNRFCDRLSKLKRDEQLLVIDLTKRFLVIGSSEYLQLMKKILDDIYNAGENVFSPITELFILPLIAPKDRRKTKSSKAVWYFFQEEIIKDCLLFEGKNLHYCDIERLPKKTKLQGYEALILLDDYIGSGDTAIDAIQSVIKKYEEQPQHIFVISIVAQEAGIQRIEACTCAKVFAYYRLKRGISDYYTGEELASNTLLMRRLERKLKVEKDYCFGYKESEALVSMVRPPNNTFPVFWLPNDEYGTAPFPRY